MNWIYKSENSLIHSHKLLIVFTVFSVFFSASVVGLMLNLLINPEYPASHLVFFFGIVFSLTMGVFINVLDKFHSQRKFRRKIDAFFYQN